MKRYEVYKDIRRKAIIFGLPLPFFALMMIAIIISLLVIIFSFSFGIILTVFIGNAVLYGGLLGLIKHPHFYKINPVFPDSISNKQLTGLTYEHD